MHTIHPEDREGAHIAAWAHLRNGMISLPVSAGAAYALGPWLGVLEEGYSIGFALLLQTFAPPLVAAANRGIKVVGVIPESDRGTNLFATSKATARYFADPANYTGTNRVVLLPARASAIGDAWDSGEPDLVHTKYAIIDPNGRRPFVVHGAANWTISGLVAPDGNDENVLILRHRDIAQAFLAHFQRLTATTPPPKPAE